jgi:hypothetical protein
MTGAILETQSQSLADAVAAIQKAKDDLYYRGHSLQKNEDLSEPISDKDDSPSEQESSADEQESSNDDDDDLPDGDHDLDDFLYPYGVTLW